MAEMKKIVYKQTPARLMAGLHSQTTFHKMGEIWQKFFQSSIAEELQTYKDFSCCDDLEENDGIDLMFNFKDKDNFEVIIGDFFKTDAKLPKNFFTKPIPEGLTAHIQIEGNNVADIVASAYLLITQAIEQTDKQIDYENFYWCEVYTKKRFSEPQKFGGKVTIDYILPIK